MGVEGKKGAFYVPRFCRAMRATLVAWLQSHSIAPIERQQRALKRNGWEITCYGHGVDCHWPKGWTVGGGIVCVWLWHQ